MRVLLTGHDGQVGRELARALRRVAVVDATDRAGLDLADGHAVARAVHERVPDLIVNAAAYTAVDRAESEPGRALAVNAEAPRVLAEEAARLDIPIVHYSTDYVFDGETDDPYTEADGTAPVNVYGRSKLLGERAVAGSGAPFLVLRVGWVYGSRRRNFLTTMLELFATRERLTVVDDEWGGPTWSRAIAAATVATLEAAAGPWTRMSRAGLADALRGTGGVYHLAPPDHATWYGLAREIHALATRRHGYSFAVEEIAPIGRAEWKAEARRPRDTRLSAARLEDAFGVALAPWRDALAECVDELAARRAELVAAGSSVAAGEPLTG